MYISSLDKGYCAHPMKEDWDWYVENYRNGHIPIKYHQKYTLLRGKALLDRAFDTQSELVEYMKKTKTPGIIIHIGPERHPAKCFMLTNLKGVKCNCITGEINQWEPAKVRTSIIKWSHILFDFCTCIINR